MAEQFEYLALTYFAADTVAGTSIYGLLWGLLFNTVGFSYLIYAKKTKRIPFLITGVAMMGYPYILTETWQIVALGVALTIVPFIGFIASRLSAINRG